MTTEIIQIIRSRTFWIVQAGGWAMYGVSTFLALLPTIDRTTIAPMLAVKMLRATCGLAISMLLVYGYDYVMSRRRSGVFLGISALLGSTLAGILWYSAYANGIRPLFPTLEPISGLPGTRAVLEYVFVMLAWSGLYVGYALYQAAQDTRRQLDEAEQLTTEARLELLTHQLQPHFLFNALSSLRALIVDDPIRARDVVTRLSGLLRHGLYTSRRGTIPLREELDAIRDYLTLEQVRFDDRLTVRIDIEDSVRDVPVPPFLIHPLAENAIKHGQPDASGVLTVEIDARRTGPRIVIDVRNTGHIADDTRDDAAGGFGLMTVAKRLRRYHAAGDGPRVTASNGLVSVRIDWPGTSR